MCVCVCACDNCTDAQRRQEGASSYSDRNRLLWGAWHGVWNWTQGFWKDSWPLNTLSKHANTFYNKIRRRYQFHIALQVFHWTEVFHMQFIFNLSFLILETINLTTNTFCLYITEIDFALTVWSHTKRLHILLKIWLII